MTAYRCSSCGVELTGRDVTRIGWPIEIIRHPSILTAKRDPGDGVVGTRFVSCGPVVEVVA